VLVGRGWEGGTVKLKFDIFNNQCPMKHCILLMQMTFRHSLLVSHKTRITTF